MDCYETITAKKKDLEVPVDCRVRLSSKRIAMKRELVEEILILVKIQVYQVFLNAKLLH